MAGPAHWEDEAPAARTKRGWTRAMGCREWARHHLSRSALGRGKASATAVATGALGGAAAMLAAMVVRAATKSTTRAAPEGTCWGNRWGHCDVGAEK